MSDSANSSGDSGELHRSMTVEEFLLGIISVKARKDNDYNIRLLQKLRCKCKSDRPKAEYFTIFKSENGLVEEADLQMRMEDFIARQIQTTNIHRATKNHPPLTVELVDGSFSLMAIIKKGDCIGGNGSGWFSIIRLDLPLFHHVMAEEMMIIDKYHSHL